METKPKLFWVPGALVGFRIIAAIVLFIDSWDRIISPWFIPLFVIAFLTDVFDGMIARKLKVSTESIRKADGIADTMLYVFLAVSALRIFTDDLLAAAIPFAILICLQGTLFVTSYIKFQKAPSYHGWSAKLWGLSLAVTIIAIFGFHQPFPWLIICLVIGWINSIEEIAMTLILPKWNHDIWSLFRAIEIRQESMQS